MNVVRLLINIDLFVNDDFPKGFGPLNGHEIKSVKIENLLIMKQFIIKTIFALFIILFSGLSLRAQFAWIDPPVPDVSDTITIFIDVSQDPSTGRALSNRHLELIDFKIQFFNS